MARALAGAVIDQSNRAKAEGFLGLDLNVPERRQRYTHDLCNSAPAARQLLHDTTKSSSWGGETLDHRERRMPSRIPLSTILGDIMNPITQSPPSNPGGNFSQARRAGVSALDNANDAASKVASSAKASVSEFAGNAADFSRSFQRHRIGFRLRPLRRPCVDKVSIATLGGDRSRRRDFNHWRSGSTDSCARRRHSWLCLCFRSPRGLVERQFGRESAVRRPECRL